MKAVSAIIAITFITLTAAAHDLWMEPETFFVRPGSKTAIYMYLGEGLGNREEKPYLQHKTDSFEVLSRFGVFDLRTLAERDAGPILRFAGDTEGTYLFSMVRNATLIEIDADKFEAYLREEGLEEIIAERKRLGESDMPGRERYSRYLKTILQVGTELDASPKKQTNARLEILPQDNPYAKRVGDRAKFQVLFAGRPLRNKAVFVDRRTGGQSDSQKLVTDSDGTVVLKLDAKGTWLIRLVHMQRCERMCKDVDWESFWATLSFGVR